MEDTTMPLVHQSQTAVCEVEAIAMLNTAKAALTAAQITECVSATAAKLAEVHPLISKIFTNLRLTEAARARANELEVMIAATVISLRGLKTASHFVELAQIAADVLRTIPISEEPHLQEAVITLHENLDTLRPTTQPFPITEMVTHSPASSSTTSTNPQAMDPSGTTEDHVYKADLQALKRHMRQVEPPAVPEMFKVPIDFNTVSLKNNNDYGYRGQLARGLWEMSKPVAFRYQEEDYLIAQVGPPHRPLFFCKKEHGPVIWAANKRSLASAIANRDYKGLSDGDSDSD